MISRGRITGLVLAGGQARRMGGEDKGLQLLHGTPLVRWALARLAPQVGPLAINANRNAERYGAWQVPVWPDTLPGYPGPLAGFLSGLTHCATPWLLAVPCDAPRFPHDLAERLVAALEQARTAVAIASAMDEQGRQQPQPVFCLMHQRLAPSIARFLAHGGRKAYAWAREQGCAIATFHAPDDDPHAFFNANTLAELRSLALP